MTSSIWVLVKPYLLHIVLVASILLNLWLVSRPLPTPTEVTKTEYVDREVVKEVVKVEYRDKIKYKDRVITRTVTKPGGTKIVQEIRETSGERVKSTGIHREAERATEVSRTESVATVSKVPRYLLHVGITPGGSFNSSSVGFRLIDSIPVYIGPGINKNGSSYNLTLNLGVVF